MPNTETLSADAGVLYSMAKLRWSWDAWWYFLLMLLLFSLALSSAAQCVAAASGSTEGGIAVFVSIVLFSTSFSGVLVRLPTLAPAFAPLPWVSINRWAVQGLIVNELDGAGPYGDQTRQQWYVCSISVTSYSLHIS